MPEYRFQQTSRTAIVQEKRMSVHRFGEPDAPKGSRSPFTAGCITHGPPVREAFSHVVQQEIGIGPDKLEPVFRLRGGPGVKEFLSTAGALSRRIQESPDCC